MNIIKQIFETPDTPSGKKRLNNLITRLGLGKKVKRDLMKDVVSGELGGGASNGEVKVWYYKDISDGQDVTSVLVSLGVQTVLCNYKDDTGVGEADIANIIDNNDYSYSFYKRYFKLRVSDNYNALNVGNGDDGIDHYYFNPNKDLYGRIDDIAKLMPEISALKDVFIEVSKEEYESQITYKNPYI